jgi:type II secretory pathway pseudopilin PulG
MKLARKRAGDRGAGRHSAFTLMEIMVVVLVMIIIVASSMPSIYRLFHKEGFRRTVNDIMEASNAARAQAILHDTVSELVIHPSDGSFTGGGKSGHIDGAVIEMLDVNLHEYKDLETARIRYFPNGTSDEFTLILRSDRGEFNKLSLDVMTGMMSPPETDPSKWR